MPPPTLPEKTRQGAHRLTIAVFLGLLWLPPIDSRFHWDKAPPPNENRNLARFPTFNHTVGGMRDFVAGLESYYNDHFGFRHQLIAWNNLWKFVLFDESTLPDVVSGGEGWLYFSGPGM